MYVCHFDMMKKMGVVEKASCIKHVWVVSSFSVCGGWRMSSLVQMLIGRKHAADMLWIKDHTGLSSICIIDVLLPVHPVSQPLGGTGPQQACHRIDPGQRHSRETPHT